MSSYGKLHSLVTVSFMVTVNFLVFMKYLPSYQNNNAQSFDNGKNNNTTDASATGSPCIQSPMLFIVVNFVYFYAIFVIAIMLHGLYASGSTKINPIVTGLIEDSSSVLIDQCEINDADDTEENTSWTTAADNEVCSSTCACSGSDELLIRDDHNKKCHQKTTLWTGDWNRYWNGINE